MRIDKFGLLLIVVGLFVMAVFLVSANWLPDISFVRNIRYAVLLELAPSSGNILGDDYKPATVIRLGYALILPLFLICSGVIIKLELFEFRQLIKIFPFLREKNNVQ